MPAPDHGPRLSPRMRRGDRSDHREDRRDLLVLAMAGGRPAGAAVPARGAEIENKQSPPFPPIFTPTQLRKAGIPPRLELPGCKSLMIRSDLVLPDRIELSTSPLPRGCSTTELRQPLEFRASYQEVPNRSTRLPVEIAIFGSGLGERPCFPFVSSRLHENSSPRLSRYRFGKTRSSMLISNSSNSGSSRRSSMGAIALLTWTMPWPCRSHPNGSAVWW